MFKRQGIKINIPDIEHADGSLGQDEAGEHEVGGGEEGDEDRGGVGAHGGGGQQHVPSSASSVGIIISGCGRTHSVAELMTVPTKEMEAAATPPARSCPPTNILSLLVSMSKLQTLSLSLSTSHAVSRVPETESEAFRRGRTDYFSCLHHVNTRGGSEQI